MAQVRGEPPTADVIRSLVIAEYQAPHTYSKATLQLLATGDLVLYCYDAGYPVQLQVAEDCAFLESWYTVAEADLAGLVGSADTALADASEGIGAVGDSPTAARQFLDWLSARQVPYAAAERINYFDDAY